MKKPLGNHLINWYAVPLGGNGDEHVARPGEGEVEGGFLREVRQQSQFQLAEIS